MRLVPRSRWVYPTIDQGHFKMTDHEGFSGAETDSPRPFS